MKEALATTESLALGILSQSTGSVLIDAAIGGTTGFLLAPRDKKNRYAVAGAVATGLGGVLGLVGTIAFIWATNSDKKGKRRRKK
jgi:predicted cation transporter